MFIVGIISTLITLPKNLNINYYRKIYFTAWLLLYYPNVFVLTLDFERERDDGAEKEREFERQPLSIIVP